MSLNKVILMGNLIADPELKELPSGTSLCSFCMAVNEKYKKASGEMVEDTLFIDVNMFGKRGEVIHKFFTKGKPIIVEGKLKKDVWEDKEGNKKSKIYVLADSFEFLPKTDSKPAVSKPDADDDLPF